MPVSARRANLLSLLRGPSRYDLRDKVVLITGGSRGLGLELARRFVAECARVAICARTAVEVERALHELPSPDDRILGLVYDVTKKGAAAAAIADVVAKWGRVDVLVNNAGIISVGPSKQMTRDDYERAVATHFWGPFDMIEAALPFMRAVGGGRIVNISSVGGKISVPHLVPYCASKFALSGLSTGLQAELARENIFVTTVHPGLMRTGSPTNASFKGQNKLEYAWFAISDSLPLLSMNAKRAAAQIVRATKSGKAEIVLSLPAKLGVLVRAIAPNVVARLLAMANELLPAEGGDGATHFGFQSESAVVPSPLTKLTRDAEVRNNETIHRHLVERDVLQNS